MSSPELEAFISASGVTSLTLTVILLAMALHKGDEIGDDEESAAVDVIMLAIFIVWLLSVLVTGLYAMGAGR